MSWLSRIFGGGETSAEPSADAPAEEYKGFRIVPAPQKEGSRYRIGARIEKDVGGEVKTHHMIRADVLETFDDAASASASKAKKMIDEQGEGIFS